MKARLPKQNMGGAQNMNAMIRQAQKMQDEITTLQEDIENREFSATSGGGAVSVVVTGKKIIKSVGMDMVKLEKYQGFSADVAASLCIFFSTILPRLNNCVVFKTEDLLSYPFFVARTGSVRYPSDPVCSI